MKHASVDRAKRVDSGCANHGSCDYCRRSRTRAAAKVDAALDVEAAHIVGTTHHRGRHLDFAAYLGSKGEE
jgi:hypothetical protein